MSAAPPRARLHRAPELGARPHAARHLRRPRRDDPLPAPARRHGGRAAAGVPVRSRGRTAGTRQLLGLRADLVLRPARGLRVEARAARGARRVPRHGQGAAPCRHRGDPRRRLQPHRRRQRTRADAVAARARERRVLHARPRRAPAELLGLRQHARREPRDRAPHDPRHPARLGAGGARRRLHARGPRLVRPQAQRGRRRVQARRQRPQPELELRRRGADRRPRGQRTAQEFDWSLVDTARAAPHDVVEPAQAERADGPLHRVEPRSCVVPIARVRPQA